MKVLIVGDNIHNYLSCYVEGFKYFNSDVVAYDTFLEKSKSKIVGEFLNIANKSDVIVFINNNFRREIIDEYVLNQISNKVLIIIYIDRIDKMKGRQFLDKYNLIYSFSPKDVEKLNKRGFRAVYGPICVDDRIYCNGYSCANKEYDISFVGSKSQKRLIYLENIAKYCVDNNKKMIVYGHYWHNNNFVNEIISKYKFRIRYPNLYRYINNHDLNPEEVCRLYGNSKICFNLHTDEFGEVNARVFEILGNNNFQLVDWNPTFKILGIEDMVHVSMYTDIDDCLSKVKFFLTNDNIREAISKRGGMFVREKYTMRKFIKEVIEDIKKINL